MSTTLSFSSDILHRMVAIHTAASDSDKSSSILSGLCVRADGSSIIIAATDGRVLMEERWTLDAGALDEEGIVLSPNAIAHLSAWLKMLKPALGKRPCCTLELTVVDKRTATLRVPGLALGECFLPLVEGSYCRYEHALRPSDAPHGVERIGYNLVYFAAVAKAWKQAGLSTVAVEVTHHRGTIMRQLRLPAGCQSSLALVMPITLPT